MEIAVIVKLIIILVSLFVVIGLYQARGMDQWSALSQLESGNRDDAIGLVGEVSRYQIRPGIWIYMKGGDPTDPKEALRIAKKIMDARIDHFRTRFKRKPGYVEFYVLWNAPGEIDAPSPKVMARAVRYRNLRDLSE